VYLSHRPIVIGCEAGSAGGAARDGFGDYRFTRSDIVDLPRIVGREFTVRAELLPVIERLSRDPAGSFRNVSALYASLPTRRPSKRAISALRSLFLGVVDRKLQNLYRRRFADHPQPPRARHDQRIASLEAVSAAARDIVSSYDWQWLADWLELDRIGENAVSCVHRLSNLAFEVRRVNFRFTYHCNIACRHCYNNSGPHLKAQRIPLEPMLAIIAQMPRIGIGHLNLTGGEPFLYPAHLTALIVAGRAAGLRGISIYTNAYWATSDEQAKLILQRLAVAGFMQGSDDCLKVSAGVYHQEFIAFDRVLTLAHRYHAMFERPLKVDFELAPGEENAAQQIRNQVSDAGAREKIQLVFRKVAPLGRARELQGIGTRQIDEACNAINQIVFEPDGSARPCCGLNNDNQGVIVGELKTHSLMDLVKHMQNDPILQFLATNPMSAIFGHLEKPRNPDGYSSKCHLCQEALGGLCDKEPVQARLFGSQKFYPFWFMFSDQDSIPPASNARSDGLD
jgi:organic radical activating enzyme